MSEKTGEAETICPHGRSFKVIFGASFFIKQDKPPTKAPKRLLIHVEMGRYQLSSHSQNRGFINDYKRVLLN